MFPTWVCTPEKRLLSYKTTTFNAVFIGFGTRFTGSRIGRGACDEKFVTSTRKEQDALRLLRRENDVDWWEILRNFDDDGYDYRLSVLPETPTIDLAAMKKRLSDGGEYEVGERELETITGKFERVETSGKYAVFTSECRDFPMTILDDFSKKVYDGIDFCDFVRDENRPELLRIRWYDRSRISERRIELFLPIK